MSDWTIKECPDCKALYENCSTCGGIGQIEEVNTAYDQNQPIGDTPSDYPAVGGEPIDARNGNDFFTVKKLQEDNKTDEEFKNVWQELDKMVEESYIKENLKSISDKELLKKRDYIYGTYRHRSYLNDIENEIKKRGLGNPDWHKDDKAELVEKLNKDGTGIARARRGVNPNNTPHKVLQFVYVSKSECDICKQYDGMQFPIDSPNRPVIPRLESVSSRSKRPYTHPNCKCKWVTPFSDAGMRNFEQTRGGLKKNAKEFFGSISNRSYKIGKREFEKSGDSRNWDDLKEGEKRDWILKGYSRVIKRYNKNSDFEEKKLDDMFDKIITNVYGSATENNSPYGIKKMIDMFVDNKFTEKEKIEIEEEHNLDFTLENLLRLVAEKIAEKESKKMGLESRKVKGNESYLPCGKCNGSTKVLVDEERGMPIYYDCSECNGTGNSSLTIEEITQYINARKEDTDMHGRELTIDVWRHFYPESMYFEDEIQAYIEYGKKDAFQVRNMYRRAKINEYDLKSIFQRKKPNFQNQNFKDYAKVFEEPIESKWARKKYNLGGDFYDFFNLEWSDLPSEIQDLFRATISVESKATEGGVGSGKKGHQKWMRGSYAGEECPNCMIRTEKKDGKCAICGI